MPIIHEIKIEPSPNNQSFRVTWLNHTEGTEDFFEQSSVEITQEETDWLWLNRSSQKEIGNKLFRFLDGDNRYLAQALDQASKLGEPLHIQLRTCKTTTDWPFELLAQDGVFLLPRRVHLVRRVSDWGAEKEMPPENRALKLLFMACSAIDVEPELDFEKEEETIFKVTEKLPIDVEVEDSGSLEGLRQKLELEHYDIVHLSGHADIDQNGSPFFIMENETGFHCKVKPEELWRNALIENPPKLVFLSGCRTGETSAEKAAVSFAQTLVKDHQLPAVLGWGRSVEDEQASKAAEVIYHELSRGRDLLNAVQRARQELIEHFTGIKNPAWPMLRLVSAGMPFTPIVTQGQKTSAKVRNLVHTTLQNSRVQILKEGFVGRRRQLQQSLRVLKYDRNKVGLLIHGTGGLGKSCLAGKICERFRDHNLIVVHGKLNTISLGAALKQGFILSQDQKGTEILDAKKEMPEKLADLCATSFKDKNYLLLFDDFEQNIQGSKQGKPDLLEAETIPIMKALLHYLPFCGKMSQMIITSRYPFSLTEDGTNLVKERLEPVPLTGFRHSEKRKKVRELHHIWSYPDIETAHKLTAAGCGNPRLMEWLDKLVGEMASSDIPGLLDVVQNKKEQFIQEHVIRELLACAGKDAERFLNLFSVFRQPVGSEGARLISEKAGLANWNKLLDRSIDLTLVEHDRSRESFQVTPLVREELWNKLTDNKVRISCHEAGFAYYENVCTKRQDLDHVLTEEWIFHALGCGKEDAASRQGGRLVTYLHDHLAYPESKRVGEWILAEKKQPLTTGDDAFLLNAFAVTLHTLGFYHNAIGYYNQALSIKQYVYGEKHPNVAICLNNLGEVWRVLGQPKKAISYYNQALAIERDVNGEKHQNVATVLNNLGLALKALGEHQKAINYYEQALAIDRTVYGENHPNVSIDFNNLGTAFDDLGDHQKAISYFEQALAIDRIVYSEKKHPNVAIRLNNLGEAWDNLGDHQKAIYYYEQALYIDRIVYGKNHPAVARDLNNLGAVYFDLGQKEKAKNYFQKSYDILKSFFGPDHPNTKMVAEWLKRI